MELLCPACSTRLRMPPAQQAGEFSCPDCAVQLDLVKSPALLVRLAATTSPPAESIRQPAMGGLVMLAGTAAALLLLSMFWLRNPSLSDADSMRPAVPGEAPPQSAAASVASRSPTSGQTPVIPALPTGEIPPVGSAMSVGPGEVSADASPSFPPPEPSAALAVARPEAPPLPLIVPRPVQIARTLSLPVVSFAVVQPTTLRLLLADLEPLVGHPFVWEHVTDKERQQYEQTTVTAAVTDGSLADVMTAVLSAAGLQYRSADNRVVISPLSAGTAP